LIRADGGDRVLVTCDEDGNDGVDEGDRAKRRVHYESIVDDEKMAAMRRYWI
jgi:hypothetical protein